MHFRVTFLDLQRFGVRETQQKTVRELSGGQELRVVSHSPTLMDLLLVLRAVSRALRHVCRQNLAKCKP